MKCFGKWFWTECAEYKCEYEFYCVRLRMKFKDIVGIVVIIEEQDQ